MTFTSDDWDPLMEALEEEECLLADGFDLALIGITCSPHHGEPVAVYDKNKMVSVLVNRDGMTDMEALEYLDFNVFGAYVGEKTPLFIDMDFMRACALMQDPRTHAPNAL